MHSQNLQIIQGSKYQDRQRNGPTDDGECANEVPRQKLQGRFPRRRLNIETGQENAKQANSVNCQVQLRRGLTMAATLFLVKRMLLDFANMGAAITPRRPPPPCTVSGKRQKLLSTCCQKKAPSFAFLEMCRRLFKSTVTTQIGARKNSNVPKPVILHTKTFLWHRKALTSQHAKSIFVVSKHRDESKERDFPFCGS